MIQFIFTIIPLLSLNRIRRKQDTYSQGQDRDSLSLFEYGYSSLGTLLYILKGLAESYLYSGIMSIPAFLTYYHGIYLQQDRWQHTQKHHKQSALEVHGNWEKQAYVTAKKHSQDAGSQPSHQTQKKRAQLTHFIYVSMSVPWLHLILGETLLQCFTNLVYPGTFPDIEQQFIDRCATFLGFGKTDGNKKQANASSAKNASPTFLQRCWQAIRDGAWTVLIKSLRLTHWLVSVGARCLFFPTLVLINSLARVLTFCQFYRISGFICDHFASVLCAGFFGYTVLTAAPAILAWQLPSITAIISAIMLLDWADLLPQFLHEAMVALELSFDLIFALIQDNIFLKILMGISGLAYVSRTIASACADNISIWFTTHPDELSWVALLKICPPVYRFAHQELLGLYHIARENHIQKNQLATQKPYNLSKQTATNNSQDFIEQTWKPFLQQNCPTNTPGTGKMQSPQALFVNHDLTAQPVRLAAHIDCQSVVPQNKTEKEAWYRNTLVTLLNESNGTASVPDSTPANLADTIVETLQQKQCSMMLEKVIARWHILLDERRKATDPQKKKAITLTLEDGIKKLARNHYVCQEGLIEHLSALQSAAERQLHEHHTEKTSLREQLIADSQATFQTQVTMAVQQINLWMRDRNTDIPWALLHSLNSGSFFVDVKKMDILTMLPFQLATLQAYNVHSDNVLTSILAPKYGKAKVLSDNISSLETQITGHHQLHAEFCNTIQLAARYCHHQFIQQGLLPQQDHWFFNNTDWFEKSASASIDTEPAKAFRYCSEILAKHGVDLTDKKVVRQLVEAQIGPITQTPLAALAAQQNIQAERTSNGDLNTQTSASDILNYLDDHTNTDDLLDTAETILHNMLRDPHGPYQEDIKFYGEQTCHSFQAYFARFEKWQTSKDPQAIARSPILRDTYACIKAPNTPPVSPTLMQQILSPFITLMLLDAGILYRSNPKAKLSEQVEQTVEQTAKNQTLSTKPNAFIQLINQIEKTFTLLLTQAQNAWQVSLQAPNTSTDAKKPSKAWQAITMPARTIAFSLRLIWNVTTLMIWPTIKALGTCLLMTPAGVGAVIFETLKFSTWLLVSFSPTLIKSGTACLLYLAKLAGNILITPLYIPYALTQKIWKKLRKKTISTTAAPLQAIPSQAVKEGSVDSNQQNDSEHANIQQKEGGPRAHPTTQGNSTQDQYLQIAA